MRNPSATATAPPPPPDGPLYAVRYVDRRGQTVTTLLRKRPAALRLVARIEARGGTPVLFVCRPGAWTVAP